MSAVVCDFRTVVRVALVLAALGACSAPAGEPDTGQIDTVVVKSLAHREPEGLALRVRVAEITPAEPTAIRWRYGGEGQGGDVIRGVFPEPGADAGAEKAAELAVGEWSAPVPVTSMVRGHFPGKFFLTITAGNPGRVVDRITREKGEYSTGVVFELEFYEGDRLLKRLRERGPDGGTVTVLIPAYRLTGDTALRDPAFLDELIGVLDYARRRADFLEGLPWAGGPLPQRYVMVNNVSGYGQGSGYGIRTTDKAVTWAELRSLRQLGVNALRSPPDFLVDMLRRDAPEARPFGRGMMIHVAGFPVPAYREGRKVDPEAGCPFGEGVPERAQAGVEESLAEGAGLPVEEVWGLTVDEIGTVVDRSPEGKAHFAECPRCAAAFRRWLDEKGLQPTDFGRSDWSQVRPLDVWVKDGDRPWLDDPGLARAAYYTRDFNNVATAQLFTPLRDALAEANRKRSGPRLLSYALRGNTFLMKGHSLDFFEFYRHADNAIVYETSNREPRIWSWDSYLCDVQRVVAGRTGLDRGIYIKPHRGAPVQRMLSATSRGNRMIYWYTYGPDYHKGDSFSQDRDVLALTSKAAHLLGRAEDVLYGSTWQVPARIAVVKPETTQRWMNLSGNPPELVAAWENAKWVYTALQHAHLPVDPIDERMLGTEDLSGYKAIYVSGTHVTRAAAEGLARYVEQGGCLYTSGGGIARDEANRPLDGLLPLLGLVRRNEPEMWYEVRLYGATSIEPYDDPRYKLSDVPPGANVDGGETFGGSFAPVVGREVLQPLDETEVLARFADGRAAVTRHRHGRGEAIVVGFFPGLEYSATVRRPDYNMRRDFRPLRRRFVTLPATQYAQPEVDASDPLVEGVLLVNPTTNRRAVTLANWAYGVTGQLEDARGRRKPLVSHLPVENLTVTIRPAGNARSAKSCALDRPLETTRTGDALTVIVPRLEEGDVLLLQ